MKESGAFIQKKINENDELYELLQEYRRFIMAMECLRNCNVELYSACDKRRQEIHDKILKKLEVERNSKCDKALQVIVGSLLNIKY